MNKIFFISGAPARAYYDAGQKSRALGMSDLLRIKYENIRIWINKIDFYHNVALNHVTKIKDI